MTTNRPEVVAWRWRKPVVNDQGETVGATAWELSDAPGFLPWWTNDPLIRLSDYEAMLAECERLRKDKARLDWLADPENAIGNVQLPAMAVLENVHCMRAAIDAAMKGGE